MTDLNDIDKNLSVVLKWVNVFKDNIRYTIFLTAITIILWLIKIIGITEPVSNWCKTFFGFALINNNAYSNILISLLVITIIVLALRLVNIAKQLFIKHIVIPVNFKKLSDNEKRILISIYEREGEDYIQISNIAHDLEKKNLITVHFDPFFIAVGNRSTGPYLYCYKNKHFKDKIEKLINLGGNIKL